jgi:hypothetical protein
MFPEYAMLMLEGMEGPARTRTNAPYLSRRGQEQVPMLASKVLTLIPNILPKSIQLSDKFDCAKTSARGSRRRESGA